MKPEIFVTRRLPHEAMRLLEENFELTCNPEDRMLDKNELLGAVAEKDGILCLLTDSIDAEVLDAAGQKLKIVANYAVGYNNIDVQACTERKISVTNTPGVLTDTTADLAMALLMAVARRIVPAERFARAGRYEGWGPLLFLGTDVHHKTLGLIGFGRIGFAMARRAAGFGMRILYSDVQRADPDSEKQVNAEYVSKSVLLSESDFVSLHAPLTPETRHIIDDHALASMKPSAYLINTSRGELVNEKALVDALNNNKIAGAGLDVFEFEPAIDPKLMSMENVVLLPHIGSASTETRTKMGMVAAENLIDLLIRNNQPPNCINPEIYENA
ncbi:MAG: 2-hydroxyacid dehydrogenase [Thermodesulfobacteriota bacterium]